MAVLSAGLNCGKQRGVFLGIEHAVEPEPLQVEARQRIPGAIAGKQALGLRPQAILAVERARRRSRQELGVRHAVPQRERQPRRELVPVERRDAGAARRRR